MRLVGAAGRVEEGPLPDVAGRKVTVDLGAGDGRFAYERARAEPDAMFIAIDPDPNALAEYSFRAGRKPARGGAGNVWFVVASVEDLPPRLNGVADVVRVNYPWAGLLRSLLLATPKASEAIRDLLKDDGRFEIVVTYDAEHDAAVLGNAQPIHVDLDFIEQKIAPRYADQGLGIEEVRQMSREEALAIPSTWGRRLLHGRPRDVYWIAGRRIQRQAAVTIVPTAGHRLPE